VVVTGSSSSPAPSGATRLFSLLGPDVSPLAIPTVYFDTPAISWVEAGKVSEAEWRRALSFVSRSAHHAVSLTTLYELLAGLAYGPDGTFVRFRDRFKLLSIGPEQTFLPLSGEFLRTRLFGLPPSRPDFDPRVLQRWLPVITGAKTRQEMEDGLIEPGPADKLTYGINLKVVQRQILKGKAGYIRRLKKLRIEIPSTIPISTWASGMVSKLGLELTLENRLRIERALDAQYRHDVSMRIKASNKDFNFKKNSTAWLDSSQLIYLAEPTFIFVTADDRLLKDIASSVQARRVMSFRDFMSLAS